MELDAQPMKASCMVCQIRNIMQKDINWYLDEDGLPGPKLSSKSSEHSKHGTPGVNEFGKKSREGHDVCRA